MESATLSSPTTFGQTTDEHRGGSVNLVARAGFALLAVVAVVVFFVFPTFPNYDSYYSLLWGGELLDGRLLSFEAYRAPTEHPLAIAFGALLSIFGESADRVLVAITLAAFLFLVWGLYRLAEVSFNSLIGLIAAALLVTRLDFVSLALRGYIDIPYLALVIWAAVLEARTRRCGWPVLALLAAAGLMRPEAWLLSAIYFVWIAWKASWRQRIGFVVIAAIAPLAWVGVDYLVTGDPLYSIHATSGLAEELDRQKSASDIPGALAYYLTSTITLPIALAAALGVLLAIWCTPRRALTALALFAAGVGTFVLVGLAGLSVIPRYLQLGATVSLIFAAVTFGGWSMLRPRSWAKRVWAIGALALVVYGVVFEAGRDNFTDFGTDLEFRGAVHPALVEVLNKPAVATGLKCGPISVPNHKLIPEVRWILDLGEDRVIARTDARTSSQTKRGVALLVTTRTAGFRQVFDGNSDSPLIQLPPPHFERVATSKFYSAYVRC